MKTKILKIAAFLLILAGGLTSCRDKEKVNDQNGEDTTITLSGTFVETYPVGLRLCRSPSIPIGFTYPTKNEK